MFAFGRWDGVVFFVCPVRNLVFPVRRCSELEFWRGRAAATLQFSRTALHRSGKSACFSSFGGVRFATFGQSPCSRPGPGLGSAPRATPVSDVSMGMSVRRCALLGERSARFSDRASRAPLLSGPFDLLFCLAFPSGVFIGTLFYRARPALQTHPPM